MRRPSRLSAIGGIPIVVNVEVSMPTAYLCGNCAILHGDTSGMSNNDDWVAVLVVLAAFFLIAVGVSTTILYFVWNWIVAGLFHGPVISWLQALGIGFLLNIVGSILKPTVSVKARA